MKPPTRAELQADLARQHGAVFLLENIIRDAVHLAETGKAGEAIRVLRRHVWCGPAPYEFPTTAPSAARRQAKPQPPSPGGHAA
jgi:hypothetical protein